MRYRQWMPAGALALAALVAACSNQGVSGGVVSVSPIPAASGGPATNPGRTAVLKTVRTSLGAVLTNSAGRTLYWLSIDAATLSNCSAACLTTWHAVSGKPVAARGVILPGAMTTLSRPDGIVQAVYDGHPLYTYFGDARPGQISGNGITAYGGTWQAVVIEPAGG